MPLQDKHCVPCEGGMPALTQEEENNLQIHTPGWRLIRKGVHVLTREYEFADFAEAMSFVEQVAKIADAEDHHPNISISYNKVELELYTHAISGLSENDFILAAKINTLTE